MAASKAWEVIDGARKGEYYYDLLPEYSDIHSMAMNRSNKEVLLGIYYNRDRHPNAIPATDYLLEMNGGWGDTQGEILFWKNFPDGPRKEATYFPKLMLNGVLQDWWHDTEPASREVVAPLFMKTVESPDRGEEYDYTSGKACPANGEKTVQVIRLSQVYCWYAEATGRAGEITAEAVDVLNSVRNRADGTTSNIYTPGMTAEELAEAAYNEHGWEIAGYYWSGFATRSRDMFRMYRYKDHFEYRKANPEIEVYPGIWRKEAVPVTGTWDDSMMYAPYPYTDSAFNPEMQ